MTAKELKQIRGMIKEIELLERELKKSPIVHDSVAGSMAEFPYIETKIHISGIDINANARLRRKLGNKLKQLQTALLDFNEWLDGIDDSEMRVILHLKYRNGLSHEEISRELGYSKSAITMKLKRFFTKNKSVTKLTK